jgi:creatinine amidohydrolase/Fe(II)-dependent formamide hydrolase-like protein
MHAPPRTPASTSVAVDGDRARKRFVDEMRERASNAGEACDVAPVCRADLDRRDVTGGMRQFAALVSLGNAAELHSRALPPDIDDRTALAVAVRVCHRTGSRYLGHVPYATDGLGDLAAAWSPAYQPFESFYAATHAFLEHLLCCFYDACRQPRPRLLVFVSGHGGNNILEDKLDALSHSLGVERCCYFLSMHVPADVSRRGLAVQHAGTVEHSVATALGRACCNTARLAELNRDLQHERSFFATIRQEPALGGMSGYYLLGDERFEAVRERYPGVKKSVLDLVQERRIEGDPELGRYILDHSVDLVSTSVLEAARAVGIEVPEECEPRNDEASE